jgi:amino acid transporter
VSTPASTTDPGEGAEPAPGGLGTFGGVFAPSILTILGLILFLRLGYVVGSGGLLTALLIIVLANGVSVLTSTSLAAVATNLRVKGGGDYYLISRTLGVEFGGPLGLVLYLAQSVSIAFYAMGFAEAVVDIAGGGPSWLPQVIASGAVAVLFVFAWIGAEAATKLQYVIMGSLVAALVAIFIGLVSGFDGAVFARSWSAPEVADVPFWTLFAIFFPAVTGFTQGVAMSGDLADASKSIPRGTFAAVYVSAVVYIALAVLLAGAISTSQLAIDYGAMRGASAVPWLVDVGVIAATVSSALASLMGAPRILQSLARDRVFPGLKSFARGEGPSNNPRRGLLLSAGLALVVVSLGDLNLIAPVVSMFFLISYGLLNYATFSEARSNSPSFRPRFKYFDRRLSLAGCLACLGAMVAIHPTAGAVALVVLFALHQWLSKASNSARWADSSRSYRLAAVREQLLLASHGKPHARDWRPVILAFSDDEARRERILRFSSWIEAGTGFTTIVRLMTGDDVKTRRARKEAEDALRAEIQRGGFEAFGRVFALRDVDAGFSALVQGHGLGPVRANTILLNWFDGAVNDATGQKLRSYGRPLRTAAKLQRNVVILEATTEELAALDDTPPKQRRIDVWFRGDATARLELLLSHLVTRHAAFSGARLRVLAPLGKDEDRGALAEGLAATLSDWRIDAEVEIVSTPTHDDLVRRSLDASLVFLPCVLRDEMPTCPFGEDLEALVGTLPVCVLVTAGEDIDLEAEPESGEPAERAAAEDTADEKATRAARLNKEAEKLRAAAESAKADLEAAKEQPDAADTLEELEKSAAGAELSAESMRRKALKAQAVADTAEREAAELSGEIVPEKSSENGDGGSAASEPAEEPSPVDDSASEEHGAKPT